MINYTLPRETFQLLEETFGSREKAEMFAATMEEFLAHTDEKTRTMTVDRLDHIRSQLKHDLAETLVTKEHLEQKVAHIDEKFKHIDVKFDYIESRFKHLDFKFNVLIGVAIVGLTLANASFLDLIKYLFR